MEPARCLEQALSTTELSKLSLLSKCFLPRAAPLHTQRRPRCSRRRRHAYETLSAPEAFRMRPLCLSRRPSVLPLLAAADSGTNSEVANECPRRRWRLKRGRRREVRSLASLSPSFSCTRNSKTISRRGVPVELDSCASVLFPESAHSLFSFPSRSLAVTTSSFSTPPFFDNSHQQLQRRRRDRRNDGHRPRPRPLPRLRDGRSGFSDRGGR